MTNSSGVQLRNSLRLFLPLLSLVASACAPAAKQESAGPAPAAASVDKYIGDFYSAHDTLYVRENNGKLEAVLKKRPHALGIIRGDTFSLEGRPLIISGTEAELDGETFNRRIIAAGTFHITPLHPAAQLRAQALAATPPPQSDTLRKPDLVELKSLDSSIKYDIRYATTNNFMGEVFYSSAHAFLQRPAAEALVRAHRKLKPQGFGLLIHDAYRPWYVTKMFWEATPDSLKDFVANPADGSRHNRGAAVDLTLYEMKGGKPAEMTGGYDEFSERAFPSYPGGTSLQRSHRQILRDAMEAEGFTVYPFEWWHFDYKDWRSYPVANFTFEQLMK